MRYVSMVSVLAFLASLCGCLGDDSNRNPVFVTYEEPKDRNDIAIVRMDLPSTPRVLMVDDLKLPGHTRHILLEPGRHKFRIATSRFGAYGVSNKYLEAMAGRTYRLKSGSGVRIDNAGLLEGNRLPVFIDVSDDPKLHLTHLPQIKGETNG